MDFTEANQLVQNLFYSIDTRNWELLATYLHNNIVYERPGYAPFIGKEEVLAFYREKRIIQSGKHIIDNIFLQENKVVCLGDFKGMSKENLYLDVRYADFYIIKEGKVLKRTTYFYSPAV